MASISEERMREMEEEMDRFEAEIEAPGGPPKPGSFILGAKTFDNVQEQLSYIRQETTRLQKMKSQRRDDYSDDDSDDDDDDGGYRDVDLRRGQGQKRKYQDDEFHDIDERPGRPQGPRGPLAPPPPPPQAPPPHSMSRRPQGPGEAHLSNILAPPPPPPPEPEGSTLSFQPYGPGEGPRMGPDQQGPSMYGPGQPPSGPPRPSPAFMPPQLRHRQPQPPSGQRPPFARPPMRMGGPMGPGGPMGGLRPPPPPPPSHMMAGPNNMGQPVRPPMHMGPGPQMMPHMGPQAGMPFPGPQMGQMDQGNMISAPPAVVEQPKVVYAAAPQITVEKKDKKKKKKKVKPAETSDVPQPQTTAAAGPSSSGAAPSGLTAGINSSMSEEDRINQVIREREAALMAEGAMMNAGVPGGFNPNMNANFNQGFAQGAANPANPQAVGGKKDKKKKEKKFIRLAASTTWEDQTLADWAQDDFRMFCGDLGNEVTDDTLVRAFNKYPTFLKAKVVRDRRTNKTKGYGFVSFKDPVDFTRAMREMNGKYVGNRPIKLRKSNWKDRNIEVVKKKDREKKRLGMK